MTESTQTPTKSAPPLTDLPTGTKPGTVPSQPGLETEPAAVPANAFPQVIEVYVCPECSSWYGSSSMGDLATINNHRTSLRNLVSEDPSAWGSVTGTRAHCQHCREQGKTVERVRVRYILADIVVTELAKGVEAAYKAEEKSSGVKLNRPVV